MKSLLEIKVRLNLLYARYYELNDMASNSSSPILYSPSINEIEAQINILKWVISSHEE